MIVKLEIQLNLPDIYSKFSEEELKQLIFDEYINYNNVSHLKDALYFLTEIPEHSKELRKYIVDSHNEWAKICDNAIWNITDVRKD